ncbi:Hypothetical_protein [Hexamita inflata]|uniref:Hypothetical_protein n=1 Tax=Hexamita inflata TaxID=28002 RepID=A0AA86U1S1_9EUKA|nr:Hypothetical protein HINF_LOCUS15603 [Hexamita inflata]
MNYFKQLTVKFRFRLPRQFYVVFFNPPGAVYFYSSENAFYSGKRPIISFKSSELVFGHVIQGEGICSLNLQNKGVGFSFMGDMEDILEVRRIMAVYQKIGYEFVEECVENGEIV